MIDGGLVSMMPSLEVLGAIFGPELWPFGLQVNLFDFIPLRRAPFVEISFRFLSACDDLTDPGEPLFVPRSDLRPAGDLFPACASASSYGGWPDFSKAQLKELAVVFLLSS